MGVRASPPSSAIIKPTTPRRRYRRSHRNPASRAATYIQIPRDTIPALAALGAYIAYARTDFLAQAISLVVTMSILSGAAAIYWAFRRVISRRKPKPPNRQSPAAEDDQ